MDALFQALCTSLTVIYATNPYTVQLLPKGTCSFCCPIKRGDIKLYADINELGPVFEFDWENGTQWQYLLNNKTTVFYVHGFTEQGFASGAAELRKAYTSTGRENLIVLDWSTLAAAPWYHAAVFNTKVVAKWLARVVDTLVFRGLPISSIHLIGFSLGAEIVGLAAKKITSGRIKRITGLDPALPLFPELVTQLRLATTDADFVDVIHTDGGVFGFDNSIGHADFYPNGGKQHQPGCRLDSAVRTGRLNELIACSHNRAWKFYAESVKDPYAFPAYRCDSYAHYKLGKCRKTGTTAYMGYLADPSLRGKFYLATKTRGPFGMGFHHQKNQVPYGYPFYAARSSSKRRSGGFVYEELPKYSLNSWTRMEEFQQLLNSAGEGSTLNRFGRQVMSSALLNFSPRSLEEEQEDVSEMYRYFMPDHSQEEFYFSGFDGDQDTYHPAPPGHQEGPASFPYDLIGYDNYWSSGSQNIQNITYSY